MRKSGMVRAAVTVAAVLLCVTACRRFPTGGIEGTVRDRYGAPLAGAGVGVVGLAPHGQSDNSGRYRLRRPVPIGIHRVRAVLAGYASQVRDGVVVRMGETTRVDFMLDRE